MNITNTDQFLLDSYSGQGKFKTGEYLIRHPRETDDKYGRRQELAVYPNYVKKVVNSYTSHLFKRGPQRAFETDAYREFCQNVDRRNTYIDDFIRQNFKLAALLGTVYVLVDKPQGEALTKQDQIEKGLFPYVTVRLPSQLVSCVLDAYGAFEIIVFSELFQERTIYRRYTKNDWIISEDQSGTSVIGQGNHSLGRVPVVPLHCDDPMAVTDIRAVPWIWDIATLNFDIYNSYSELRELFRSQTFSILSLPVRNEEEASKLSDLTISTENALPYNPEGGGKPEFIAPSGEPAKLYMEHFLMMIDCMYQLANLEFTGGTSGGKSASSEVALAFHFQSANAVMANFASQCEKAEDQIADLVCRWEGKEFKGEIDYPRNFAIVDLLRELQVAMDATTMKISPVFDQQVKKRVARAVLGEGIEDATMKQIDAEIEAGDDPYGDRIRDEAKA